MDDLGGKPLFLETSFIVPLGLFVKVKDVHLSSVSWCFAEGFSGLERHLPPPRGSLVLNLGWWSFERKRFGVIVYWGGVFGDVFWGQGFTWGGMFFLFVFGVVFVCDLFVRCEENFWV